MPPPLVKAPLPATVELVRLEPALVADVDAAAVALHLGARPRPVVGDRAVHDPHGRPEDHHAAGLGGLVVGMTVVRWIRSCPSGDASMPPPLPPESLLETSLSISLDQARAVGVDPAAVAADPGRAVVDDPRAQDRQRRVAAVAHDDAAAVAVGVVLVRVAADDA